MSVSQTLDWWPATFFERHPVNKVVVCGRQLDPPQFSHVVGFPRIELPLKGVYDNQIESGGKAVNVCLKPGHALFAAPNCWNLPTWRRGLRLLSIMFGRTHYSISIVSAPSYDFDPEAPRKISIPRQGTGPTPAILNALLELHVANWSAEYFVDLTRALVRCINEMVSRPAPHRFGRAQLLLEEVRIFLQSQYQFEINRDSVAQQFSITPNHLSRLFQQQGNGTFSGYLTSIRIERAKYLLTHYKLKLNDIAVRCGYHDTPYFCHVFKRLTRLTPMEYRLQHKAGALPKAPELDSLD
jgi:AraC-like DNA-binding protein